MLEAQNRLSGRIARVLEKSDWPCWQIDNIYQVSCYNVKEGSHIKSNGYRSYLETIARYNLTHSIVYHYMGLVNELVKHTNSIENVCRDLNRNYI